MRLISLSANQQSFKTVNFNKTGASFVLAKQSNPEHADKNKTYNGVGKSLLVALINFCLGAGAGNKITKSLQQKLPDWCFTLTVESNNQKYIIQRCAEDANKINLNGEYLSLLNFNAKMEKLFFDIPENIKYLSYRSLMPFFIRPSKRSYLSYDEPEKSGSSLPYQKQLYNAFLLGLNVELSQNKMLLKKDFDETGKRHKNIESDPILKEFFQGRKDTSLALIDLDEKIILLKKDLDNFEVADDYYDVEKSADEIKKQIDEIKNQLILKDNAIDNIQKSLVIAPDVNRQDIEKIYNESKLVFREKVKEQLGQLEVFYQTLTINRTKRLRRQQQMIDNDIKRLNSKFEELKINLDGKLKFLNAHRALDIHTQVSSQLSALQQQKEKLQSYEKLKSDYENKKNLLKQQMLMQTEQTNKYIETERSVIDELMAYFRRLVKNFYPNASAGITVHNNNGENQIRYNIDAKIESDTSDGINSVKLFCYDLTLLKKGFSHNINFIFHDSRLFSSIDGGHINDFFQVVKNEFAEGCNDQYIATINQNQINELAPEYQKFVNDHQVLELTDNSDDGKLLGVTVELEYD